MIDVNVSLSHWPFRRLPHDSTTGLVEKLQSVGVQQAWGGSFEAVLHEDADGVNRRLKEQCETAGGEFLVPFGCVNISLPDWEEDLRRCQEVYHMPGIRLFPNYHGYKLDDPDFVRLLSLCEKRQLIVQICLKMEDNRTQHPLVQVADVETAPLLKILPELKTLKLVLLNCQRTLRGEQLTKLAEAGNVWFDISMQEGIGGVGKLIELVPYERVLLGSHFPFFYFESAALKLKESELGETIRQAIAEKNARTLLS